MADETLSFGLLFRSPVASPIAEAGNGGPSRKSVFDYAVDARSEIDGEALTDDELAQIGINFILAGNDTSGLGILAILACLALVRQSPVRGPRGLSTDFLRFVMPLNIPGLRLKMSLLSRMNAAIFWDHCATVFQLQLQ